MFKKINELKVGSIVKLPYNNVFSYKLVGDDGDVPSANAFEEVIYAGNILDFAGGKSALFIGKLDKCGWVLNNFEKEKNLEPNTLKLVKANQDKKGWFVEASYQLPVEVISEPIDEVPVNDKPVSAPLSMSEQIALQIDEEIIGSLRDGLKTKIASDAELVSVHQLKIGDIVSVPINNGGFLTDGYNVATYTNGAVDGIVINVLGYGHRKNVTVGLYNKDHNLLLSLQLPEELKGEKITHQWTIFEDFKIQRKGNLIENKRAEKTVVENNTPFSPKEIVKEQKKKIKLSELKIGQKILAPLNEYGGVIAQTSARYNPFNHKDYIECTVVKVNSNKLKDQFGSVPAISIAFDKQIPKLSWFLSDIKNNPYFKGIPEEFLAKKAWHIYDDYEVEVIGEMPIASDETKTEAAQAVVSNNTIDNNNLKEVKNMKQLSSYKVGDEVRVFLDEDGRVCDYETVESVRAKVLAHNPSKDEVILGFPGDAPEKTTEAHRWKRLSQFGLKPDGFAFIGGFRGSRDHYAYSEAFTSPDEYEEEIYEDEEEEDEEVMAVKPAVVAKRHADKKVKVVSTAAPVVPKRSLVDMIKSDAKEAAYRSAATQMTTGTKAAILMLLESKGKHEMVATVSEMLDTELGSALISMLLGMGLTYAPMISEDPRAKKLATEFRTSGISTGMNVVIGTAMETVVPLITNTLKGLPAEETPAVRLATPEIAAVPTEEVKPEVKTAAAR